MFLLTLSLHAVLPILIGFYVVGVGVALHLEDGGELLAVRTFADVDDARILAGAAVHPRRFGREFLPMEARAFIAAMLGPHDRENAEFDKVRHGPSRGTDALIFFRRQAVLDRQGVVTGKSVTVRVEVGVRRCNKNKSKKI